MKKLTLLSTLLLAVITITAQIIHVPADQPTIQAGIDASSDGDTVLVAEGTYLENINFNGMAITVASEFSIDGDTSHIANTIIDGSEPDDPDQGSVVTFNSDEDTTSVLYGFTITGGSGTLILEGSTDAKGGGGIMLNRSGAKLLYNYIEYNEVIYDKLTMGGGLTAGGPTTTQPWLILIGNKIRHNKSVSTAYQANGGGLEVYCNLKMYNNEISYNMANGGEISLGGGASLIGFFGHIEVNVKDNKILHNYSISNGRSEGGGLSVFFDISGVIANNEISFNSVETVSEQIGYGAGVLTNYASPDLVVENNFVTDNYFVGGACYGGGLTIWHGGGTYQNNIIQNNSGTNGGGVSIGFESDSVAILINNTITGNEGVNGGGLFTLNIDAVVINTILWNNEATSGPEIYQVGGSLNVRYSNVQGGWTGAGNMDVDPLFKNDGYHLTWESPLANQGEYNVTIDGEDYYSPEYDFENDERPYADTKPDIGADEKAIINVAIFERISPDELSISIFPNPVSQSTNIQYVLNSASVVQLKICNQLGEQVEVLVDEFKPIGKHQATWNCEHLSSGIYFCVLKTDNGTQTRKMIKLE